MQFTLENQALWEQQCLSKALQDAARVQNYPTSCGARENRLPQSQKKCANVHTYTTNLYALDSNHVLFFVGMHCPFPTAPNNRPPMSLNWDKIFDNTTVQILIYVWVGILEDTWCGKMSHIYSSSVLIWQWAIKRRKNLDWALLVPAMNVHSKQQGRQYFSPKEAKQCKCAQ